MRSTRNHIVKLSELFMVIQHHIFFDILLFNISIFPQYILGIENDRSTVAEVDWAFCNDAQVIGVIYHLRTIYYCF